MHPSLPPLARFPLAREHSRSAEIIAEINDFILTTWPFKTQAEREQFVDWNVTAIITKCVPDGDYEKTLWLAKINVLFFHTDECFESNSEEKYCLMRGMKKMMTGETQPGDSESPLERMCRDIYQTLAATCTPREYQRYVEMTGDFFRAQDPVYHTEIVAYLEFRRLNAFVEAGYLFFGFAQYALDIHLTDEEWTHPLLTKCLDIAMDLTFLENDVASYEKEIPTCAKPLNLVAMLLDSGVDGVQFTTPLDAKMFIRGEITKYEKRLYESLSAVMCDSGLQESADAQKWARALPYIVSGNFWWSQSSSRYNIPGKPVLRKVIHLEDAGDIIELEPGA
ncbi:isoprenoid synthase domain-containing protein [Mycena sanguinolenta]|nr:isoprenoid synthase domain-containing protein [Mycena sanguinolenta]